MHSALELLAKSYPELGRIDPVVANLLVAKGLPALADLEIDKYARTVDGWARDFRKFLFYNMSQFDRDPHYYRNDIRFYRLIVLHVFLETHVGVAYNEDQRELKAVEYTNPSDLFLNGVIDTRRGTCGNMSALLVALCWRLRWPVSLACMKSHFLARFDDGEVVHNIESTVTGIGGCGSDTDVEIIQKRDLTRMAIASGSDLRALRPRETLGVFFGLRAQHHRDSGRLADAESDYLLARWLFPVNHHIQRNAIGVQVLRGAQLFDWGEDGHPSTLGEDVSAAYPPDGPPGMPRRKGMGLPHRVGPYGDPWWLLYGQGPTFATLNDLPPVGLPADPT